MPYLQQMLRPACDYSAREMTDLAFRIIRSKLRIIARDPTERGYGLVLEYGHTFATPSNGWPQASSYTGNTSHW